MFAEPLEGAPQNLKAHYKHILEVMKIMKRLLTIFAMFAFSSLSMNLAAQQTLSTQTPSAQDPMPQAQADATNTQQSARSFEGRIAKSGEKLVLRESSTKASYQLDDQSKAKQFQGKDVMVTATLDSGTNTLHVVDINAMDTK